MTHSAITPARSPYCQKCWETEKWGDCTLQKKIVLLIPAHVLPHSPKHRPSCPQCIFTQLLICNPKRTKATGHSLPFTQPGSSKLLASDPAQPLPCPATAAEGFTLTTRIQQCFPGILLRTSIHQSPPDFHQPLIYPEK